ncbi:MFS transporter [Nonomuraea sp. NPDC050536]|uniref:MFS transporter n=1 Tax=Nonomuraea sp. NPDC050536 TaxID=3364366 RepID=UPI0037C66DF3
MTQDLAEGRRSRTLALWTISIAQLMFLLDATVVNVALPSIKGSLGFSGSGLEWVVTGYSLAFGGLLLLGGRAGDILGRRRMFVAGLALFTVASLLGGLATTPWWLLVCRAVQGVGAAAASPAALSLIATTFPEGPERDRAVGIYSAVATAGGGVGLLAGGVITTYLSWRWVMFVNVPFGVFIVIAAMRVLTETERVRGRFDLAGALTGTAGVTLLVYGLINAATDQTGTTHWADTDVLVTLGAAVLLIAAFVASERRNPHALVPLRIFIDRVRAGTYIVQILSSTAMFGIFFFLTLFLQQVWGYTPLQTAVVYVPLTGLLVYGARLSSRLVAKTGVRNLVIGGLLSAAAGMAWLSQIGDSSGYLTGMLVPTVLTYAGLGLTGVPLTLSAMSRVPAEDSGTASGVFSAARQVGGATGLAVLGTVAWAAASAITGPKPASRSLADHALAVGAGRGFAVAAGIVLLALLVAALTLPRGRS